MATFSQADFGVYGNTWTAYFALRGPMQFIFHNVTFPFDVKLQQMGMQVGAAWGISSTGGLVPKTGGFYGRYCVWDSSGNLLSQTGVVSNTTEWGHNSGRPYTYGSFTSQPVLKAGVTYRLGFYRASNQESTSTSFGAWQYGVSNPAYFNANNITWPTKANIDAGAGSIAGIPLSQWTAAANGAGNVQLGFWFQVVYEKANSGAKRWNGSKWEDRGILRWNGSAWDKVPLKKWDGGSWQDVN